MKNNIKKKFSLKDAHDFAEKFQKIKSIEEILINYVPLGKALKYFADKNDEDNFKKAGDKYFGLINSYGKEELKKDAYPFLEFVCSAMDNGFTNTGYSSRTGKKAKEGSATKLLRKLYSPICSQK